MSEESCETEKTWRQKVGSERVRKLEGEAHDLERKNIEFCSFDQNFY
jgi:hypothetical protein